MRLPWRRPKQREDVARQVEDLLTRQPPAKAKKKKKAKPRNRGERRVAGREGKKKGDLTRKSTHKMRSNDGMGKHVRTFGCRRKGY